MKMNETPTNDQTSLVKLRTQIGVWFTQYQHHGCDELGYLRAERNGQKLRPIAIMELFESFA